MRYLFFLNTLFSAFIFFITLIQFSSAKDIEASLNAAAILKEKMDYKAAIGLLEENATEINDTKAANFLGRLYYLDGNSQRALGIFTSLKEKDWISFVYLGLINEDLAKYSQAVKNYLNSLKLKQNSIALYRLGKIFYQKRLYPKAARFFLDTLSCDSSIRLANYYLGSCFVKIGDYEKAYRYSARGINFYPDNLKVRDQLKEIKNKLGNNFFLQLKEALEKTRTAVELFFYGKKHKLPLINVGIAKNLDFFAFKGGGNFVISDTKSSFNAEKGKFYYFIFKNKRLFLTDRDKKKVYGKFKGQVVIRGQGYPFYILDVAYGKGNYWHKKIDRAYRGDLKIIAFDQALTLVNILDMEDYLYGVLAAEILPSAPLQALKAQAVAARTLAFERLGERHKKEGFDVCADVHCQVYQGVSSETPQTNKAVDETQGEVLFYQDKPAKVIYHNNCGGLLRSDAFGHKEYFANQFDILPSEKFSKMLPHKEEEWFLNEPPYFCSHSVKSKYRWQRIYDANDFLLVFGFPLSELEKVIPQEKADTPYYKSVEIFKSNEVLNIKGDLKIRDYFDKLRSSSFKVEIKFSPQGKAQMLIFLGAGFGHGVGMCQDGAEGMAARGYNYREILKHYYPDTRLKRIY
jgi:SpoIID/LytB domain protein